MFWLLSLARLDSTFCLRFIDPYGNTIFHRLQIPILQTELSTLSAWMTESNLQQSKRAYREKAQAWPTQAFEEARSAVDIGKWGTSAKETREQ